MSPPIPIPIPTSVSSGVSTSTLPPKPTDFTVILPFPPPSSTTVTSLVTIQPTSITRVTMTNISTNVISTVTEISTTLSLSITAILNPAATSEIAGQSSLLRSNASLSRTNITVSLILGTLSLLLIAVIFAILILYIRRRRKHSDSDDESPPFTSLAPRPGPNFTAGGLNFTGSASAPILPPSHMRETSPSMGPRGGTADSSRRALAAGLTVGAAAGAIPGPTVSTPRRMFFRSLSAPVEAPMLSPRRPAFRYFTALGLPSMNLFGRRPSATHSPTPKGKKKGPRSSVETSPSEAATAGVDYAPIFEPRPSIDRLGSDRPALARHSSMPLYHEALRSQAEMEREASRRAEADRLGLPVIAVQRSGARSDSSGSKMFEERVERGWSEGNAETGHAVEELAEESRSSGDIDIEMDRKAGLDVEGRNGVDNERSGVLHSTRASSGVFPETERALSERSEIDVYS
ncbi:hypothetical protein ONS95_010252 [Cadophora gregata]|uniref:uncharacterized protein n=1 Tax=Cadophora gregata TaxID=51156 RepID=UPI0026DD92FB|nr:uncharacterized protein ONS95_010252 [Cadophora gregata]KAK0121982.1 hypothetical protein ONS95_010252 [Cadophora gregata]